MEDTIFDWAGLAAFIGMLGTGAAWLFKNWGKSTIDRDDRITAREQAWSAKTEARMVALEENVAKLDRAYGVMIGVGHLMLDELEVHAPASLALVRAQIRIAYPVDKELPTDLLQFAQRLDRRMERDDE